MRLKVHLFSYMLYGLCISIYVYIHSTSFKYYLWIDMDEIKNVKIYIEINDCCFFHTKVKQKKKNVKRWRVLKRLIDGIKIDDLLL